MLRLGDGQLETHFTSTRLNLINVFSVSYFVTVPPPLAPTHLYFPKPHAGHVVGKTGSLVLQNSLHCRFACCFLEVTKSVVWTEKPKNFIYYSTGGRRKAGMFQRQQKGREMRQEITVKRPQHTGKVRVIGAKRERREKKKRSRTVSYSWFLSEIFVFSSTFFPWCLNPQAEWGQGQGSKAVSVRLCSLFCCISELTCKKGFSGFSLKNTFILNHILKKGGKCI